MQVINEQGLSIDGIVATNTSFDSPSEEEPKRTGHLRNADDDPEDNTEICFSSKSGQAYFPLRVVTRKDLAVIVSCFERSEKTECDAWRVFAELTKLQPFQDGNKRTALIAANAAAGTLVSG
ncbi:Fic family protein [Lacticaseibacillus mingshuiensis]|uniref:Fic family protein n=1 Tax=Lacticaseibacillus mingshuiensis TaxID=2799574 RepID=A0ABW4CJD0_9LACO|nr:Fic family protein [Lacticaseibacillus mingshuiensis]